MEVQYLMSRDPSIVSEQASVSLGEALATAMSVRHVPVVNSQDKLVGVISIKDVLHHFVQPGHDDTIPIRRIMTPNPIAVSPSANISETARLMRDKGISCVPVVDDTQHVVGIVTERDFVQFFLDQQE